MPIQSLVALLDHASCSPAHKHPLSGLGSVLSLDLAHSEKYLFPWTDQSMPELKRVARQRHGLPCADTLDCCQAKAFTSCKLPALVNQGSHMPDQAANPKLSLKRAHALATFCQAWAACACASRVWE